MWQRNGQRIRFVYSGDDRVYSGVVERSRVKYGGVVQHSVRLDDPVIIYGTERETLLVDEPEVLEVLQ